MTTIAKYFTTILLVLTINESFGQQNIFNLYMYDMKLVNPAFAGTAEAQIFSTDFQTSHTKIDGHPYALYAGYENWLPKINSGIGSIITYTRSGSYTEFRSSLIYDYQFNIGERRKLSIGGIFGYQRSVLDPSKFRFIDPDDPLLAEASISANSSIDLNFGALLLINNFKIGLSTYNLIQAGASKHPFFPQTDNPAVNFTIENKVDLTEWVSFRPSLLYLSDFSSIKLDLNGVFEIKNLILIGGNYEIRENDNNLNLNGGVVIKDKIEIILLAYSRNYRKIAEMASPGLNFEVMARLKFQ